MRYDLKQRTAKFGGDIIRLCQKSPKNEITRPLINQLIRSATSVGANYMEADDASSAKDLKYRISICNREAKEARYWLDIVIVAIPSLSDEVRALSGEARELNLIFSSISRNLK